MKPKPLKQQSAKPAISSLGEPAFRMQADPPIYAGKRLKNFQSSLLRSKEQAAPEPNAAPRSKTENLESQASPTDSLAEQARKAHLYFEAQKIPKADIPTSRQQRIEFLQNDKRQAAKELRELWKADND